MLISSILFLLEREEGLKNALRGELKAHAITLQTALEENFDREINIKSQSLIDRLRENSQVYSVTLLDENGQIVKSSHPETKKTFKKPDNLSEVFKTGKVIEFNYQTGERNFISIVLPVRKNRVRVVQALMIVKPLDLINQQIYQARLNWLAVTLFLLAIIFLVVTLVLRKSLTFPILELLKGVNKFGEGDLEYRIKTNKNRDELSILGQNFNRMADKLLEQRKAARKETENRFALEKELRHTERLASVGRLAAGVAHELGTPLNVIDARAAQILTKNLSAEKKKRNLEIIRRQTARITHLVQQLLNLARPFNLKFSEINLTESIRETVDHLFEDEKRIKVDLKAPPEVLVKADENFLRQVWINILENARQAVLKKFEKGGRIYIVVDGELRDENMFITIAFTDTGGGIEMGDLERIFDPFYTTKDIGQGTGLGLTVAHRIIDEHNGFIEVKNIEEKGAEFRVFLPVIKKEK
jgi:signal transduction histidine kinase